MRQSIEKSFLVDPLTINNAIYRDSLILSSKSYRWTAHVIFTGCKNKSQPYRFWQKPFVFAVPKGLIWYFMNTHYYIGVVWLNKTRQTLDENLYNFQWHNIISLYQLLSSRQRRVQSTAKHLRWSVGKKNNAWLWLNMNQYPWISISILQNAWINFSKCYARALNMPDHLTCLTSKIPQVLNMLGFWKWHSCTCTG